MPDEPMTLRQHRRLKMMSIRDLASAAGMGTQTIVKIERGDKVRPSTFDRIAKVLDVKPEEIREFMVIVMSED